MRSSPDRIKPNVQSDCQARRKGGLQLQGNDHFQRFLELKDFFSIPQVDLSCMVSTIRWYHEMENGTEVLIKVLKQWLFMKCIAAEREFSQICNSGRCPATASAGAPSDQKACFSLFANASLQFNIFTSICKLVRQSELFPKVFSKC